MYRMHLIMALGWRSFATDELNPQASILLGTEGILSKLSRANRLRFQEDVVS